MMYDASCMRRYSPFAKKKVLIHITTPSQTRDVQGQEGNLLGSCPSALGSQEHRAALCSGTSTFGGVIDTSCLLVRTSLATCPYSLHLKHCTMFPPSCPPGAPFSFSDPPNPGGYPPPCWDCFPVDSLLPLSFLWPSPLKGPPTFPTADL